MTRDQVSRIVQKHFAPADPAEQDELAKMVINAAHLLISPRKSSEKP